MVISIQSIHMEDCKVEDVKLTDKWVLWVHNMTSSDWSISGYERLFEITNVSDFWMVINNIENLGLNCMHLYIMKDGVNPIWEDENNRDGGICSFKIDYYKSLNIIERLCMDMVLGSLVKDESGNSLLTEINGISISPKINSRNNWLIIKLWNKHNENDISKMLNGDIVKICKNISIQYKSNKPEY